MLLQELSLNEGVRELHIENLKDIEKAAETLTKYCSEFINVYKETDGKFLYRGTSDAGGTKGNQIKSIRKNRQPIDVSLRQHNLLEQYFKELGLKANRKNSIFCSTSKDIAADWGNDVKIIFVRDGWEGTAFKESKTEYAFYTLANAKSIEDVKKLKPFVVTPNNLDEVIEEQYVDLIITGSSYFAFSIKNKGFLRLLCDKLYIPF